MEAQLRRLYRIVDPQGVLCLQAFADQLQMTLQAFVDDSRVMVDVFPFAVMLYYHLKLNFHKILVLHQCIDLDRSCFSK